MPGIAPLAPQIAQRRRALGMGQAIGVENGLGQTHAADATVTVERECRRLQPLARQGVFQNVEASERDRLPVFDLGAVQTEDSVAHLRISYIAGHGVVRPAMELIGARLPDRKCARNLRVREDENHVPNLLPQIVGHPPARPQAAVRRIGAVPAIGAEIDDGKAPQRRERKEWTINAARTAERRRDNRLVPVACIAPGRDVQAPVRAFRQVHAVRARRIDPKDGIAAGRIRNIRCPLQFQNAGVDVDPLRIRVERAPHEQRTRAFLDQIAGCSRHGVQRRGNASRHIDRRTVRGINRREARRRRDAGEKEAPFQGIAHPHAIESGRVADSHRARRDGTPRTVVSGDPVQPRARNRADRECALRRQSDGLDGRTVASGDGFVRQNRRVRRT